ncbi:hypothetical protein OUZ56_001145 [Daphnia magna]|uniref:Uncharacterized protein n=1 Tax=Daphnia magna TaxID=35525 RepID=A0ABR0A1S1_9CRUS|nr:hypothetical protein OUZ56_001145 [Daphnia magna]
MSKSVPIELLISPPSYELENGAKFSGTVASTADDKGNCVTSKAAMMAEQQRHLVGKNYCNERVLGTTAVAVLTRQFSNKMESKCFYRDQFEFDLPN